MSHDLQETPANPSFNMRFEEIIGARVSRRRVLQHGFGAAALSFLGGSAGLLLRSHAEAKSGLLGFPPVPVSSADMVIVPLGYAVDVIYAWGEHATALRHHRHPPARRRRDRDDSGRAPSLVRDGGQGQGPEPRRSASGRLRQSHLGSREPARHAERPELASGRTDVLLSIAGPPPGT